MYSEYEEEGKDFYYSDVIKKRHFINKIPAAIGIFIILLGFIDMIIFIAIPFHEIKKNKKKLPNYSFKNPNIPIIIVHFILHFLIILIGIFLIFFSLENFDRINKNWVKTGLIVTSMLTIFMWIVQIGFNLSFTNVITSKTTVNDIISILTDEPPVDFIFVYSQDKVVKTECSPDCEEKTLTCYSKSGVKIPVISQITSHVYDFTDVPEMFYFYIDQEIQLTLLFSSYFTHILNAIQNCDFETEKAVDYYPLIKGTYVVSKGRIPKSLTKTTRIVSFIFGVGVYYELYTKSIPLINFRQKLIVDANPSVDYINLFTHNKCNEFGECDTDNSKPKP